MCPKKTSATSHPNGYHLTVSMLERCCSSAGGDRVHCDPGRGGDSSPGGGAGGSGDGNPNSSKGRYGVMVVVVGGGELLVVIVDTEAGHISKALIIIACIWQIG